MATPRMEPQTITPALAAMYLSRNAKNRPIRKGLLAKLKSALVNGEWVDLNGETIKFNGNGELIDGQHRLQAVVDTGKTINSWVLLHAPNGTQDTTDVGQSRTPGDIFGIHDIPRANVAAATSRYLLMCEADLIRETQAKPSLLPITPSELVETYSRYPHIAESLNWTDKVHTLFGGSHAQYAALFNLFAERDYEAAKSFYTKLISGLGLTVDDPVYALRRVLEANRIHKQYKAITLHALFIRAWNYYRQHKPAKRLNWSREDALPTPL